jgi:butyryl-CoA dehydrogenase
VDEKDTAPTAEERDRARLLLEVLTPIVKAWPAQWCTTANDLAIQVLGGYGYTREYDVEQHYRDNRLNAIHEGTNGIQALDLLGRKVVQEGGAGLAALRDTLAATVDEARAAGGEAADLAEDLAATLDRLLEVTVLLQFEADAAVRLANATPYLEAAGHLVIAWIWLEQYLACGDADTPFHRAKRAAARYFYRYELPRVAPALDLLAALDRTTVDLDPAIL